jgi:L-glyceraldehyde 3-phosphate reductase
MKYEPSGKRYEGDFYRRCGDSGLLLPMISLGLWHNFGGVDEPKNFKKILFTAFDHGITHFDLANNYGPPPGSAEENFGKVLKNNFSGYRDELIISTKAGYRMWPGPYGEWGSRKYLLSSLDQSLKRMKLDYVDIFYSHRYDPNTPLEETMGALVTAIHSGKALYAGISNYGPRETEEAIRLLNQSGIRLLIHQPKYSMLVRTAEEGLLDVLKEKKTGCIPFSPLAQGLLTNRYLSGIPKKSRAAKSHGFLQEKDIIPELVEKIRYLNDMALERGQTLAQMAVAWLLQKDEITSVLVGASSPQQLTDILEARKHYSFSSDELIKINVILGNT